MNPFEKYRSHQANHSTETSSDTEGTPANDSATINNIAVTKPAGVGAQSPAGAFVPVYNQNDFHLISPR